MKIGIYGVGKVGSIIAYSICLKKLGEVILYDQNYLKTQAEVLDIKDGTDYTIEVAEKLQDLMDVDIIINCTGCSNLLKETDGRYKEAKIVLPAILQLCSHLKKSEYKGFILNVSNPNDYITEQIYRNYPTGASKIFGTGTWLDTNRFRNEITEIYLEGEHGKAVINNKYKNIIENRYQKIITGKGYTAFGIAQIVCFILEYLQDKKQHKVVLSYLKNEKFKSSQVYLSSNGIKEIEMEEECTTSKKD